MSCRNNHTEAMATVPSDIYHVFVEVNDACRGDGGQCVGDSKHSSERRPSTETSF
jgi:hypothetical protein